MKDPNAVALGRKGGKVGGVNRSKLLTPERRQEISRNAAMKRWHKKETKKKYQISDETFEAIIFECGKFGVSQVRSEVDEIFRDYADGCIEFGET